MTSGETDELSCSRLGDLLELVIDYRGKTPRKLGGDFADSGVPVISAIHIKNGRIAWEERERFVTQEMFKKWMKDPLRKGDVLLTSEAPLGEVALVPNDDDVVLSQRLFALRPNPELLDAPYLMYFLKSTLGQRELQDRATGSTVVGIRQAELVNISVQHPSLRRQKLIGQVLSNLDFKIDKNQELSTTLERMAVGIFKSWFIDFDPVKAKMAGEAPVGMDAETAALFPDSMEESKLGDIPAGWSVGTFVDFFGLVMGQSPPGSAYNSDGVGEPFFQGRAEFGERFPTQRLSSTLGNRRAAKGDVLVSVRAPVGDQNQALVDCIIGRGLAAIRHKSGSRAYSYEFVRSIQDQLDFFNGQGSVFGSISKRDFESLQVLEPPDSLVRAFDSICSPIDELLLNIHVQNMSLSAIRDALLPRLISGELQIPDEMLAA